MNTLRFGLQTEDRFRIGFEYYGIAGRYSDEFQSPVAIPQGERIKLAYNPLKPEENSRSRLPGSSFAGSGAWISIGLGGAVMLSLGWLSMMHGCR